MDTELISKKDLLVQTGISYGQLYRWKRKGLIPEDWFVRKSTFTGQETFFPRDRVLKRIERILTMKDEDRSLDDIADAVAPDLGNVAMTAEDALGAGLVSQAAVDVIAEIRSAPGPMRLGELLAASVHDALLQSGDASADEGRIVVRVLEEGYASFEGSEADLLFVRKMGFATCLLVNSSAAVVFESGARLVSRVKLQDHIDELAARLGG